ncbi:MAG: YgiQ family radical SAM protein [Candidatus Hadarchaeota archaeon]
MIAKTGTDFDIVFLTADYYDDHPMSPAGVIARVLDSKGYNVGIIEKPETKEDFARLGAPKLCFFVTSGSVDSMVNNYTPLKKKRAGGHSSASKMPDRAVIVYCNGIKRHFKSSTIIIGGIEASLRRFAHYDYWDNDIRRSILLDSRADILVYGGGEKQAIEIADRLRAGNGLRGVPGTCVMSRTVDADFEMLPSFKEAKEDKVKFCQMQVAFSNCKNQAQRYENNYVLQYRSPDYTTKDLDWIYSLGFTRKLHPRSLLKMAQFSVVTHRGCIGRCNFCSIFLHHGDNIISRSEANILNEIKSLAKHPDFRGYIDDLGGPSANMYGMDCEKNCGASCMRCAVLDRSHRRLVSLMRKARAVPGVKKVFVRSGIRYDLALESEEYIKELTEHHISGTLKIAPEHFSEGVLKLMNKDNSNFDKFVELFKKFNKGRRQALRFYIMIGHPGDDELQVKVLSEKLAKLRNIEQFQLFTPTPMTISSCMYWTGLNPFTLGKVKVVHDYHTKKKMKRLLLDSIKESHSRDMLAWE